MINEKPEQEGMIVIDSGDIAKIREVLNTSVAHMTRAAQNIEIQDAVDVIRRLGNPEWDATMDRHLRHFQHSKAAVEYASWMLGQAQQEKSEQATKTLASRLNWITAAMTGAVLVQAIAAGISAWLAWKGMSSGQLPPSR